MNKSKKLYDQNENLALLERRQSPLKSGEGAALFTVMPNELIVTIFEYLRPVHIVYSFHSLNTRFSALIERHMRQVDLCDVAPTVLDVVRPLVSQSVISLKTDCDLFWNVKDLYGFEIQRSYRDCVRRQRVACFRGRNFRTKPEYDWHKSVSYATGNKSFSSLFPSLQNLWIRYEIEDDVRQVLLAQIPSLNRLRKLKLEPKSHGCFDAIPNQFLREVIFTSDSEVQHISIYRCAELSDAALKKFSSANNLTTLDIELFSERDVFILFNYLPNIVSFACEINQRRATSSLSRIATNTATSTPLLKKFNLAAYAGADFSMIVSLLKTRTSLEFLSLDFLVCLGNNDALLDGNTLQNELLQYLTKLKTVQFDLRVEMKRSGTTRVFDLDKILSTFQNQFWLREHNWNVGVFSVDSRADYFMEPNAIKTTYYLFTLPYCFASFDPRVTSDFLHLKATCLSQQLPNMFNKVKCFSVDRYDGLYSLQLMKFIATNFKCVTDLILRHNAYDEVGKKKEDHIRSQPTPVDEEVQLSSVEVVSYFAKDSDLKRTLLLCPNIAELHADFDALQTCTDHFQDKGELLQQFKKLDFLSITVGHGLVTGRRKKKIKVYLETYLPNITLDPRSTYRYEESESEDD